MANKILKLNADTLKFEEISIKNRKVDYKEMREAVGGYIEHIVFNRELEANRIDVWCDEEGKLKNLKASVIVLDDNCEIVEVLAGSLVFTGKAGDGNSYGLTDEQVETIKEVLRHSVSYANPDGTLGTAKIMPYK